MLSSRLSAAERRVKRLFRAIPRTKTTQTIIINQTIAKYDYELSASQQEALEAEIRVIVDDELLETRGDRVAFGWYWLPLIDLTYRQGTSEEVVIFNRAVTREIRRRGADISLALQPLELQRVLQSSEYLEALARVEVENFQNIKTLSNRTSDQVIQRINAGISAGEKPSVIARDISQRFDVSRVSAKRIADTSVNKAYNDAKMNAVDVAAKQTGLRAGVIHISALIPTTRPHHAARHGNAYTVTQQNVWWNDSLRACHLDKFRCLAPADQLQLFPGLFR